MRIYSPLKHIAYFGTMMPLTSLSFLKKVLNATGQPFGVDWSGPACNVNPSWPCNRTYYQHLGLGAHNGLDMPAIAGTPIYASHDGVVQEVHNDPNGGLGVIIWDDVQLLKTVYWHNKVNLVTVGQRVKQGDKIAEVDNTGYSLGNHLHFMLKQTDNQGNTINTNNGFKGAIDPLPHLVFGMTQEEVRKLYRLAFYREPDAEEMGFWVGKSLLEFLNIAIKDRADFLLKP